MAAVTASKPTLIVYANNSNNNDAINKDNNDYVVATCTALGKFIIHLSILYETNSIGSVLPTLVENNATISLSPDLHRRQTG